MYGIILFNPQLLFSGEKVQIPPLHHRELQAEWDVDGNKVRDERGSERLGLEVGN